MPFKSPTKRFVPIYMEELKFAIVRFGWKVTKLYNIITLNKKDFKAKLF